MNLTGSRATLIVNICAVIVAAVVAIEGYYILFKRYGVVHPLDLWGAFVPALVMFIVRGRIFSYCFLFFYVVVLILLSLEVRLFYLGLYKIPRFEMHPLAPVGAFLVVSTYILAIYAVGSLIWFAYTSLASKRTR
jgi:hypothetical protein